MKPIQLSEKQAEKQGIYTPYAVAKEQIEDIENGDIKHIIYITQNSDDEIAISCSALENTQVIGLLECGKQQIINDMYD